VDGLPLGIELAASRLRILSPQALLARLERRLQVLAGGTVVVAPRQQTLRNTLAWSHDLLDGAEQTLFRRLSVFAGGCSAEEVEAVCVSGDERELDVFEGLTSLVDKSVLVSEEQEADDQRLHMLDTTGEFARECLEASGEAEMMLRRHAMYYLTLAERAEPELRDRDQGIWLTRLDRAHGNIRAVLQWIMDHGQWRRRGGNAPGRSAVVVLVRTRLLERGTALAGPPAEPRCTKSTGDACSTSEGTASVWRLSDRAR